MLTFVRSGLGQHGQRYRKEKGGIIMVEDTCFGILCRAARVGARYLASAALPMLCFLCLWMLITPARADDGVGNDSRPIIHTGSGDSSHPCVSTCPGMSIEQLYQQNTKGDCGCIKGKVGCYYNRADSFNLALVQLGVNIDKLEAARYCQARALYDFKAATLKERLEQMRNHPENVKPSNNNGKSKAKPDATATSTAPPPVNIELGSTFTTPNDLVQMLRILKIDMRDVKPQGMYDALRFLTEYRRSTIDNEILLRVCAKLRGRPDLTGENAELDPDTIAIILKDASLDQLLEAGSGAHIYEIEPAFVAFCLQNDKTNINAAAKKELLGQFGMLLVTQQQVLKNEVLNVWIESQPAPKHSPIANLSRRWHQAWDIITTTPSTLLGLGGNSLTGLSALGFTDYILGDKNAVKIPTTTYDLQPLDIGSLNTLESAFMATYLASKAATPENSKAAGKDRTLVPILFEIDNQIGSCVLSVSTEDPATLRILALPLTNPDGTLEDNGTFILAYGNELYNLVVIDSSGNTAEAKIVSHASPR